MAVSDEVDDGGAPEQEGMMCDDSPLQQESLVRDNNLAQPVCMVGDAEIWCHLRLSCAHSQTKLLLLLQSSVLECDTDTSCRVPLGDIHSIRTRIYFGSN